MIQGSEEWFAARVGKVTASRVHDIIATTKSGGYSAGRGNYLAELVAERLTGTTYPSYQSPAMAYGSECEPEARFAYALACGIHVKEVGFIDHPTIDDAGASPDGLVGDDGLVEIKCPNTKTHIDALLGGKMPVEYASQVQFQLSCTGRKWCDLVSFDRRLPPKMQLHILRLKRNDDLIDKIELEVKQFLIDVNATADLLRKRYEEAA